MAKKRTMNELRQTKEYKIDPVQQVLAKQIEELAEKDAGDTSKYGGVEVSRCPLDPVEEAKILIVAKITKHFHDVMFEMVNEEMSKSYVFQSEQYLTQAGYDEFEDEWFEFYHEHHGDILYQVMQNITN